MMANPDQDTQETEQDQEPSNYWGDLDGDDLGNAVITKFKGFRDWTRENALEHGWRLKLHYYFNEYRYNPTMPHLAIMQQFGAQGEYQFVSDNNLRSVLKTILSSVVENPPSFSPRATNTDADAKEAAALYSSVLDYYKRVMKLDQKLAKAAELAIAVDMSFMMVEWDQFAPSPQTQRDNSIWNGDLSLKLLGPWDVCYDWMRESWADLDWVIVRDWVPRQKVLLQFPTLAKEINGTQTRDQVVMSSFDLEGNTRYSVVQGHDLNEEIQVFKLFFRDSPWMPNGRHALFLETGKMLYESPAGLVYPRLPVEPFFPDVQLDALLGYSPINELMGIQEAINTILSSITTNAINYANQYVVAPEGSELNPKTLDAGHKLITYPVGQGNNAPAGLNLTSIPDSLFKHLESLYARQQAVVGVSNPSRGQSTGANMTGSAGLFLASQTTQNQGPMTANFASFSANVMTLLLRVLRVFGRTQRTIEVMGSTVASKEIILSDALKDFDEVVVDASNPIMDTAQGRMAFAQQMMQYGNATPTQVLEVATSGNLNAVLDAAREKEYYIEKENQWLSEGSAVQVFATDDHNSHILKHSELLNDPSLRKPNADPTAPQRAKGIMDHITQHMNMLKGNAVNSAAMNPPGSPGQQGHEALGTAPPPQPKDTGQVGQNNPAQGQAVAQHTQLPNMPQRPRMPG